MPRLQSGDPADAAVREAADYEAFGRRLRATEAGDGPALCDREGPKLQPWIDLVNEPETRAELDAIRAAIARGRPYGSPEWRQKTAEALGLEAALRPRGRPKAGKVSPRHFR